MFEVIVPATSANIGPGFDCLGIALNLYNKFYFEEIENGLEINGCDKEFQNENNLVYKAMKFFIDEIKPKKIIKGIRINIESNIPICRGLGSSATCIVAGIVASNYLCDCNLSKDELLKLATKMEGHPDNVAPALFGNLVVSIMDNDNIHYNIVDIDNKINFLAMIPDFTLSTKKARDVLPEKVNYTDAIFNISRSTLLISSLISKNYDNIKVSFKDKLHQDYRGLLINDYFDIIDTCDKLNCLGSFLSGAGPTIMALSYNNSPLLVSKLNSYLSSLKDHWVIETLHSDKLGTITNILK